MGKCRWSYWRRSCGGLELVLVSGELARVMLKQSHASRKPLTIPDPQKQWYGYPAGAAQRVARPASCGARSRRWRRAARTSCNCASAASTAPTGARSPPAPAPASTMASTRPTSSSTAIRGCVLVLG